MEESLVFVILLISIIILITYFSLKSNVSTVIIPPNSDENTNESFQYYPYYPYYPYSYYSYPYWSDLGYYGRGRRMGGWWRRR